MQAHARKAAQALVRGGTFPPIFITGRKEVGMNILNAVVEAINRNTNVIEKLTEKIN